MKGIKAIKNFEQYNSEKLQPGQFVLYAHAQALVKPGKCKKMLLRRLKSASKYIVKA